MVLHSIDLQHHYIRWNKVSFLFLLQLDPELFFFFIFLKMVFRSFVLVLLIENLLLLFACAFLSRLSGSSFRLGSMLSLSSFFSGFFLLLGFPRLSTSCMRPYLERATASHRCGVCSRAIYHSHTAIYPTPCKYLNYLRTSTNF